MTKHEIHSRRNSEAVIYECDVPDEIESGLRTRWALEKATRERADLRGADLSGAYLSGAYLSDADLSGAYLRGADLSGAYLSGAYLRGADLSGAYLPDADLSDADLSGAYLRGADLRGAYLSDADLSDADLSDADLSDADLRQFKADLFEILLHAPHEVAGLREKLMAGQVDGSLYKGACACLVGTIANVRHVQHTDLPGITPDSGRPAEQWFMAIRQGDTPATNKASQLAVEWIDEFRVLTEQMRSVSAQA